MLAPSQIKEIRNFLNESQNPIFFFDNDSDGLCSFLLLRRFCNKGKGVPIKGSPELTSKFFKKVIEFNSDCIFILDKPLVSEGFFEEVNKFNIPVVWIDHHYIKNMKIPSFVNYYNPIKSLEENGEAVTAFCYYIASKKEDLWIATAGSIADKYLPPFYSDFKEKYPDLSLENNPEAFDVYYKSGIGKISRIIGEGLKDRTTNVINMLKFLIKVKSPYEVLNESKENYFFHKRFKEIEEKKNNLINKALNLYDESKKILFFEYKGDLSISAEISNELSYKFPNKFVIVAYNKGITVNISARGKKIKKIVLEAIKGFDDASGGGHNDSIGAKIKSEDLKKFRENLNLLLK
jgi:oligoribonuclease NrnB/cAMP/cGMP phosphodiesterase (DHH superfamily)